MGKGTPGRWLALLAIMLATTTLFIATARGIGEPSPELRRWRIGSVEMLRSDGAWRVVSLPHEVVAAETAGPTWYRVALQSLATQEPRALFVPRAHGRLDIHLDGSPVGGGGPTGPSPRHRPPFFLLLPGALARADAPVLGIRADGPVSVLDEIYVGPARDLRAAFDAASGLQVRGQQIILGVLLGVALMTALLFSLRPRERHYGWFSLAALACALHLGVSLHQGQSTKSAQWELLAACLAAWAVICAALFANRFLDRSPGILERWLLATAGALTAASGVGMAYPSPWLALVPQACYALSLGTGAYLIGSLVRSLQAEWRSSTCLLLAVTSLVAAVHLLDRLEPTSGPLLVYTAIPALTVIGGLILASFAAALKQSEALHRQFDLRVAASNLELERSFAQLEAVQREQALSRERQRIMRDMHDGIGGQLLQAMASVESDAALRGLAPKLRASLDDLRLVVDSLGDAAGNLAMALATLRWRTHKRCQQSQARCEWIATDIDADATFRTEEVLQALRAIQRGVDLALAQAGACVSVRVRLTTQPDQDAIHIEVAREGGASVASSIIAVRRAALAEHSR